MCTGRAESLRWRLAKRLADRKKCRCRYRMRVVNELQTQVTSLLVGIRNGDPGAADRLMRLVYDELHRVAHIRVAREGRKGDLQTTVLVQEAYVRLLGGDGAALPQNRRQFFAFAANAMRQYLVDDARKRGRIKRGGGQPAAEISETVAGFDHDPAEILAVDEALQKLRQRDPQKAKIVELRFFTGLTVDETADVLGISARQVDKEWHFARAWLHRELS